MPTPNTKFVTLLPQNSWSIILDHGEVIANWASDNVNTGMIDASANIIISEISLCSDTDFTQSMQRPVLYRLRDYQTGAVLRKFNMPLGNLTKTTLAIPVVVPAGQGITSSVQLGGTTSLALQITLSGWRLML